MTDAHPFSRPIRLNQIGQGVTRTLEPDAPERAAIARWLDLEALDEMSVEVTLAPAHEDGVWALTGRVRARVVQACGLTLHPLPALVDQSFKVRLAEESDATEGEIEVTLEDDAPDLIENGQVDLGHHAVEQLSLALDPFPRAPGAEFQPPEPEAEISPFGALRALKLRGDDPGA
jgi:uncharacterized metal-binding protein YceD (DUF177 family)